MGRAQNAMAAAMDARVSLAAGDMPSVSADDIVATTGEAMLPLEVPATRRTRTSAPPPSDADSFEAGRRR
jgi:hypothetical protein